VISEEIPPSQLPTWEPERSGCSCTSDEEENTCAALVPLTCVFAYRRVAENEPGAKAFFIPLWDGCDLKLEDNRELGWVLVGQTLQSHLGKAAAKLLSPV